MIWRLGGGQMESKGDARRRKDGKGEKASKLKISQSYFFSPTHSIEIEIKLIPL